MLLGNKVEKPETLGALFHLTADNNSSHGDLEGHNSSHGDLTVDNSRHLLFNKIMDTMLMQLNLLVNPVCVGLATTLTSALDQSLLRVNDVLTKS